MVEIFEKINRVEDILKQDPVDVYDKMDYDTKIAYRNKIKEISKKTKISELYISKKCLELSKIEYEKIKNSSENKATNFNKKCHIGYYLLDEGRKVLLQDLTGKKQKSLTTNTKMILVILALCFLTIGTSSLFAWSLYSQIHKIFYSILLAIFLLIPIEVIWVQIGQYIIGKLSKPKIIPKLDYMNGVPEESSTFIVIPTILNSKQKVQQLMERLEVYYMANKSDNIYLALLGDCTSGSNEKEPFDDEVILAGKEEVKRLNEKYPSSGYNRFHFIYRKRTWNAKEECYLGWERKRGLLNQFNEYILGKEKNSFLFNTIDIEKLPKIKYVITLDSDTRISFEYWFRINWCYGSYFK